jgi:hypothetical protein
MKKKLAITLIFYLFLMQQGFSQTKFRVAQPMLLAYTRYYEYKSSEFYVSTVNSKWVAEIGLINGIKVEEGDTLRFIQRFTFTYENTPYAVIKYSITGKNNNRYLIDAQLLELNNSKWIFSKNEKFEYLVYAIKTIKARYFQEFEYIIPKDNRILAVKELFSGEDKMTNLSKLGKYLMTKPKEMEPFCDF